MQFLSRIFFTVTRKLMDMMMIDMCKSNQPFVLTINLLLRSYLLYENVNISSKCDKVKENVRVRVTAKN